MPRKRFFIYISLVFLLLAVPITIVVLRERTQYRGGAASDDIFPPDQPYFSKDFALPACGVYVKKVTHSYDETTGTMSINSQFVNRTNETRKVEVIRNSCRCEEAYGQYGPEIGFSEEWRMCFGDWPKPLGNPPLGNEDCASEEKTFTIAPKQFQEDTITTVTSSQAVNPNCGSFQLDWIVTYITDGEGNDIPGCPQEINQTYVPLRAGYGLIFTGKDLGGRDCRIEGPECVLTPTSSAGEAPLSITFDGSESSDPDNQALTFEWKLDGTVVANTGPTYTNNFTETGTHKVSLVVTAEDGAQSDVCESSVTIGTTPVKIPVCENGSCIESSDPNDTRKRCAATDIGKVNVPDCLEKICDAQNACVPIPIEDYNSATDVTCNVPADCVKPQHKACADISCAVVTGPGKDTCAIDTDCQISVCTSAETCEPKGFADIVVGTDILCSTDADCNIRNVCHNMSCIEDRSPGQDECTSDKDCEITYKVCVGMACVERVGDKEDQCRDDEDCFRQVCEECACIKEQVSVDTPDECTRDEDCPCGTPTHLVCTVNDTCEPVDGYGADECRNDADCAPPEHLVCTVQETCEMVEGFGQDECTSDIHCQQPDHRECTPQETCGIVTGPGQNECTSDTDCQAPTHLECTVNETCEAVTGPGQNQCRDDNDCKTPEHRECVGPSCHLVTGPGQDLCDSDADCVIPDQPTYKTCLNETCVVLSGTPPDGVQLCETDAECKLPEPPLIDTGVNGEALAIAVGTVFLLLLGIKLIF